MNKAIMEKLLFVDSAAFRTSSSALSAPGICGTGWYRCLRRCRCLLALVAIFALTPSQRALASGVEVSVGTSFGEQIGKSDDQTGSFSASASAADSFFGASASGNGSADISAGGVILSAYATGNSNDDHTVGGNANVTASASDDLRYQDPQVVTREFLDLNPFIHFVHRLRGSTTYPLGGVNFSVSVRYEVHRPGDNPGEVIIEFQEASRGLL